MTSTSRMALVELRLRLEFLAMFIAVPAAMITVLLLLAGWIILVGTAAIGTAVLSMIGKKAGRAKTARIPFHTSPPMD